MATTMVKWMLFGTGVIAIIGLIAVTIFSVLNIYKGIKDMKDHPENYTEW